jgi:hypothetical protein
MYNGTLLFARTAKSAPQEELILSICAHKYMHRLP